MVRFLGATLIVAACSLLAYNQILKKKAAITAACELRDLLIQISQHISFSLEPLPELIHRLFKEGRQAEDSFLAKLSATLCETENLSFSPAWSRALQEFLDAKGRIGQTESYLLRLGETMGTMDSATERARLQEVAEVVEKQIQEEKKSLAQTEKTTKSLGILCGVFIVLLLL